MQNSWIRPCILWVPTPRSPPPADLGAETYGCINNFSFKELTIISSLVV